MTEIVVLDNFSLAAQGPTCSISLRPGKSLAIVGPAASGKTKLLRCLAGQERVGQGSVHVSEKPKLAGRQGFTKRSTPQSILNHALNGGKTTHVANVLLACGLWDIRLEAITGFSSSQVAACELLYCLGPETRLLLIDGQLDRLDPWTLSSVLEELKRRMSLGAALVTVTNRPELLTQFDFAIVLDHLRSLYSGSVDELLKKGPRSEVHVASQMQPGVRALVEPLVIGIQERKEGIVFHTENGQELAARLLLEGYGDIDYVVVKQPTIEQSLMHLTKTSVKKLKN